jgi:hypothetical protein
MAKRPDLTSRQRKIVDRYYQHLDTITITKLQELVSELYLAEPAAAARLWKRAETALAKSAAGDAEVRRVLETRDVQALARLVQDLSRRTP